MTEEQFQFCLEIQEVCRKNKKRHGFQSTDRYFSAVKSTTGKYPDDFLIQYRGVDLIHYKDDKILFHHDRYKNHEIVNDKFIFTPEYCDLDINSKEFSDRIKSEIKRIDEICKQVKNYTND